MSEPTPETTTGAISRLEAEIASRRASRTEPTPEPTPTPAEARAAVLEAAPRSTREAGTFVLIDELPALLIKPVELLPTDTGHLDVWVVQRFTPTGPEIIDRHGFADA